MIGAVVLRQMLSRTANYRATGVALRAALARDDLFPEHSGNGHPLYFPRLRRETVPVLFLCVEIPCWRQPKEGRVYFNSHFKVQSVVAGKARLLVLDAAGLMTSAPESREGKLKGCCCA